MKRFFYRISPSVSLIVLLIPLLLNGCNNGSGSKLITYSGIWDVRYNFNVDDCFLVAPEIPGFVDQHIIDQDGAIANFEAVSQLIVLDNAAIREDGTLLAVQTNSGDFFGDGSFCTETVSISYDVPVGDEAATLLVDRLTCNDGFVCESRGIGQAIRQPV